ncbi:MAG: hypothetical protein WCE38_07075, partial [Burkholderiales bacterium]
AYTGGAEGASLVLGTFVATFVYCLLVLRTIRRAGEFDGEGRPVGAAGDGYLQYVDADALMTNAERRDLAIAPFGYCSDD